MDEKKRKRLEKAGWQVGDASTFLGLSPEEAAFVEIKLSLARGLRSRRTERGLTQEELAREVGSSQSRVAKMEAADPSVTVDLLVRSLLKIGASRADVARLVRRRGRDRSSV